MRGKDTERLVREMGLTREEFFRTLPSAVTNVPSKVEGDVVTIRWGHGSVEIRLGLETDRKLGSLAVPSLGVEFRFDGLTPSEREGFLAHFDHYFQRGGG